MFSSDIEDIFYIRRSEIYKNYVSFLEVLMNFNYRHIINIALIFLQNPKAKILKSYEEWKEIGFNVEKGSDGINLFNFAYKDGKLKIEFEKLFDISQTDSKMSFEKVRQGDAPNKARLYEILKNIFKEKITFSKVETDKLFKINMFGDMKNELEKLLLSAAAEIAKENEKTISFKTYTAFFIICNKLNYEFKIPDILKEEIQGDFINDISFLEAIKKESFNFADSLIKRLSQKNNSLSLKERISAAEQKGVL